MTQHRQQRPDIPDRPVFAAGFSGGGDSTALLIALRAGWPDAALHALIVDHRLRADSRAEAELAARRAQALGATPHVLVWDAPRPGQGPARTARHRLMALACRRLGVSLLCLGHTLDDRVETLRMRAARQGGGRTLAAMGPVSASPVWPEGRSLTIARPLLGFRRDALRAALRRSGADWIDDPSNADSRHERVRVRQGPPDPGMEAALLNAGDSALAAAREAGEAAYSLVQQACAFTSWGGVRIDRDAVLAADVNARERALSAVLTAAAGAAAEPGPGLVRRFLTALTDRGAMAGAGAHLTASRMLGRDPGAAGRADGAPAVAPLTLAAGETGVFDGRHEVSARAAMRLSLLGARRPGLGEADAPGVLRPGLILAETADGPVVAGDDAPGRWLLRDRVLSLTLPPALPTWFDARDAQARSCAALEFTPAQPHI